jgi:hypothetical protein
MAGEFIAVYGGINQCFGSALIGVFLMPNWVRIWIGIKIESGYNV